MSFLQQLGAKLNANVITLAEYTTYKAGVVNDFSNVNSAVSGINNRVVALEAVNHASLIATAKSEAIASAKTYTDGEVTKLNTSIASAIETAANDATSKVTAASNSLTTDIAKAKSEAISAASTDATSKVGALNTTLTTNIATAKSEAISAASTDATSKVDALNTTLTSAIATKVTQASAGLADELAAWDADGKLKGSTYSVDTSLSDGAKSNSIPTSNAVVVYINGVTTGVNSAIHPAVQGITQLRALDTTSAVAYPDKMLILVEDMGQYRLDRESEVVDDGKNVIAPTVGTGRWLRFTTKLTDHNLLSSIQGGGLDENYHLTKSSYEAIEDAISKGIVTDDDVKLSNIAADGTIPNSAITYTNAEWDEFVAALTAARGE